MYIYIYVYTCINIHVCVHPCHKMCDATHKTRTHTHTQVAYCVFICVWSVLMIKFWERKQNALAYYWFTSDLALEEKVCICIFTHIYL